MALHHHPIKGLLPSPATPGQPVELRAGHRLADLDRIKNDGRLLPAKADKPVRSAAARRAVFLSTEDELVLVTSEAVSQAQDKQTQASLNRLTIWLVVFTVVLVGIGILTLWKTFYDVPNSPAPKPAASTSAPSAKPSIRPTPDAEGGLDESLIQAVAIGLGVLFSAHGG